MKRLLFFILSLGIGLTSYSQKEINEQYRTIPAQNQDIKDEKNIEFSTKQDVSPILEKSNSLVINADELFMNTNLYKPDSNVPGVFYRRNQFLGGFRTSTFISTIRYRDAATVDGDKIKIYLNDKVIKPEVTLDNEFQGFTINLIKGINKIDFEALNEGFASPNTAEFEVYDQNGTVIESSQWNVGTGYKATLILYKE